MNEAILLRELYLIRHAESDGNVQGYSPDELHLREDPYLTETGKTQAELLGEYLKDENFDAVYSSGLRRTVMTANGIIKKANNELSLEILPDLCEIFMNPDYSGQSLEELKKLCPKAVLAPGIDKNILFTVPDETPGDNEERYFERAKRVLDYVFERYNSGERVCLVSHAGFLTYIIFYLIGYRDKEPSYDFRLSNTGITKILFYQEGTNRYGDMVFDCINARTHLG